MAAAGCGGRRLALGAQELLEDVGAGVGEDLVDLGHHAGHLGRACSPIPLLLLLLSLSLSLSRLALSRDSHSLHLRRLDTLLFWSLTLSLSPAM